MRRRSIQFLSLLLVVFPVIAAPPAQASCPTEGQTEEVLYTWKLRGGLAWIAGLAFPTSGTASLKTTDHAGAGTIETELMISGGASDDDYYRYESMIEEMRLRTVTSFHGYAWGRKFRQERTRLDYGKKTATTTKRSYKTDAERVKTEALPGGDLRDVLTGIYYLRAKANTIDKAIATDIYSDGELYPVLYKPLGRKTRTIGGKAVQTIGFAISARPGQGKSWDGGVEVWFTADDRSIPVQININQRFATMELELASVACGENRIIVSR